MLHELLPIIFLWVLSFVFFAEVPSLIGYELSYSSHPFLSALYYGAWLGAFLGLYPAFLGRVGLSVRPWWYITLGVIVIGAVVFYTYIIPFISTPAEIHAVVAAHPEALFLITVLCMYSPKQSRYSSNKGLW